MGSVSEGYRLLAEKASVENANRPIDVWFRASSVNTSLGGIGLGTRKLG
jgi:hypothetical protein